MSTDAASRELVSLRMIPMRVRRMRLERASRADTEWLRTTMGQTGRCFGTRVAVGPDGLLQVAPGRTDGHPRITQTLTGGRGEPRAAKGGNGNRPAIGHASRGR